MSRKNSKITLRVHNKGCNSKHNSPGELINLIEEIEKLNFIKEPLGKAKWKPISSENNNKIDIIGFDYFTKSFSVNIYGKNFQQKFYIKVDFPKNECLLEKKCIEMIGIEDVMGGREDSYYSNLLKIFYEGKIVNVVEDFYKE